MATQKKQSIFAQRMQQSKKIKVQKQRETSGDQTVQSNRFDTSCFGDKSNILCGPDADIIHQENLNRLAGMTPTEIEEERKKLLENIEPSLVEFLKSRKSSNPVTKPHNELERSSDVSSDMDCSVAGAAPGASPAPVADLVDKFPHMNVVEPDKLEWMQDLSPPQPPPPGCPYNARFNFEGELLPFVEEKHTEGLHHHGEEPERPGYTLQELMQLSRSSILQQRITAVSTLANIFLKASDYDYCLDTPLLPQLLDSELYLLLRFTLDDPVRSVVSAAIAAISNLLVNIKDEGCLDRLLGLATGLRQPSFYVHLDLKPNELAELKDTELLKVDVIRGALRTHLLPRFRYIFHKLNPEPVEIGHMLRCLIRIARHSYEAALTISDSSGLLTSVRKLLDERPPRASSEALKLFRVMACQSSSLAAHLIHTYNILQPIQRFIAGDHDETTMSLVLESFYTWQTLLSYHLTTEQVSSFLPVVQRLLMLHAQTVSLDSGGGDLEHATALLSWLSCVSRTDSGRSYARCCLPAVRLCALKWLSQAVNIFPIKWAACKAMEAVLNTVACLEDSQDLKNSEITHKIELFLSCENFKEFSQTIRRSSWLLEGEKCSSVVESLPCLGSIPPTLHDSSPLPLVMGLALFVYTVRSPLLSEKLVFSEGVQSYMEEVVTAGVRTTTAHWFARQELVLIYTLLQIHLNTQNPIENSLVHQAALFLSTSIHADDRYMLSDLFDQVIFNRHFFRPEITDIGTQLQNLDLNSDKRISENKPKLLSEALDSLETICHCYQKELGLEGLGPLCPPPTLTASPRGIDPALPADWHFLLVVHLNNIEGKREDAVSVATSCLQWSLVLECLRPQFVANLNVASRFCRLACVLLAGNDLFRDVREWLREVLQALLVHNEQMDFSNPIPGLKSFYDFYREIVEQFVGVSYGDTVFGQFVLLPLQQRHEPRLRKLVWCELGAALRFLSTPPLQIGVPLVNFLEPCETDPDLLFIYLKALGQGRIRETFCPVLFRVAVHHVATYISKHPDLPVAKRLNQMIDALGNQELKHLLSNYCNTS